jgi:hypothetical protein
VFGKGSIKLGNIGVIETSTSYTRLEIVQTYDPGHPAEIKEGVLVGPDEGYLVLLPHRLFVAVATARKYHPEYPGTAPPSTFRVKGRWSIEEVHLRLFARQVLHDSRQFRAMALYLANKAFYRAVAMAEMVIILQILPDTLGAQPFGYRGFDDGAVRLTGTL